MANWQRRVKLQPEWDKAKDGEITIPNLAGVIARRLKQIRQFGIENVDYDLENLIDEFDGLSGDESADVDDLDALMAELYDWGDRPLDSEWNGKKVCWVDTTYRPVTEQEPA